MSISERLHTQKTWLITGVAGFIGSNLLETLLRHNQKVVGVDNFSTGNQHNIDTVLQQLPAEQQRYFTFYEGDITSFNLCEKAMHGIDIVLHQAALASIPKSVEHVDLTHQINVDGFFNLLLAANKAAVERFVYASSCAVYGNNNSLPHVETQSVDILSPYNATKYMNEVYAEVFSKCYGLNTIGLRYFNIYGPRQDAQGTYAAVINRWINELSNNKPTFIHDDVKRTRDFCYVDDVVAANILAATTQNPQAMNTVYNIGTGNEVDISTLYQIIATTLDVTDSQPISKSGCPGELARSQADISKAKNLLEYSPHVGLEEGIATLVRMLKDSNP